MATRKPTTKPAAAEVEETVEETVAKPTTKQLINEGIVKVIEATGIDVQKNRYKAMRAIAFQAFSNAIEDGTFDALVDEAIANIDELPSGWEIERSATDAPAKPAAKAKAPVKKAPAAKAPAAKAATVRKRPAR